MATTLRGLTLRPSHEISQGVSVLSQSSTTVVLNSNALLATGLGLGGGPSNDDTPLNPHGIFAGTVTNHANCVAVDVPDGATYLDICIEWPEGDPDPSTLPTVTAFGAVLPRAEGGEITTPARKTWPSDFDSTFFNPGSGSDDIDWKPLGNLKDGLFRIVVGDASTPAFLTQENGTTKRGSIVTINVTGVRKVLVPIFTAGVGPTKMMVIGWFGS